jgi:hypothetical protein
MRLSVDLILLQASLPELPERRLGDSTHVRFEFNGKD